jgi:hypothetical protein
VGRRMMHAAVEEGRAGEPHIASIELTEQAEAL